MSSSYGEKEVRVWIMGFGLILILIGIALMASWTGNVILLPMGFFVFMLGAAAFAVGIAGYAWWDRPPVPRVRCRQCYAFNYETSMKCHKCGSSMF